MNHARIILSFPDTMAPSLVLMLVLLTACGSTSGTLLLKHFPKAGGSFMVELGRQLLGDDFQACHEFHRLSDCMRQHPDAWVIGIVREPCSMYLSLWAYGSEGHGEFRYVWQTEADQLMMRGDQYDPERFRRWVHLVAPDSVGPVSLRFYHSYISGFHSQNDVYIDAARERIIHRNADIHDVIGGIVRDYELADIRVDCWVDTNHLLADFARCMRMYNAARGANVDLTTISTIAHNAASRANASHHGECIDYCTNATAMHIARTDDALYRMFSYSPCQSWRRIACNVADLTSPVNPCDDRTPWNE